MLERKSDLAKLAFSAAALAVSSSMAFSRSVLLAPQLDDLRDMRHFCIQQWHHGVQMDSGIWDLGKPTQFLQTTSKTLARIQIGFLKSLVTCE